jgi:ParB-like chromosome segregation protein Spo0J
MENEKVDLHLLELRYAHIRVKNEARVPRLADSISRHGQLEAMLTIKSQDNRLILVDGYQRHTALKYLGQDVSLARVADEPESQSTLRQATMVIGGLNKNVFLLSGLVENRKEVPRDL